MLASSPVPAFRLRSTRGVLTMRELWQFARHVALIMGHEITVEGVEFARPLGDGRVFIGARPLIDGQPANAMNINKRSTSSYHFPRAGGLAVWQHLAAYHAWLMPQLEQFKLQSDNFTQSRQGETSQRVEFETV